MDENKPNIPPASFMDKSLANESLALGIAWIVTLTAIIAGYVPLLLTIFLIIFVVMTLAYKLLRSQNLVARSFLPDLFFSTKRPLTRALLAFALYIALSSLWSADIRIAMGKALLMAGIVLACDYGRYVATTASALQLHRINRGILIGSMIALAFPIIELATNMQILNFLAGKFPSIIKTTGTANLVPGYYLNKNVSVLGLFFWPALMVLYVWKGLPYRRYLLFSFIAAIIAATFLSQSETAKVALALGAAAFLAAQLAPRPLHLVAQGAWILATLGAVPLVMALHASGAQNNSWLGYSARDRIHIWNYTAKHVRQNPVFGIGVRSSRSYKLPPKPALPTTNPGKLKDRQGWHSHNIFLQTWYELGAVGAIFLLAIGLFMLQRLKELDPRWQPFAYAAFASFGTNAAFGYGIWQSWLLSSFGWTVIFFIFVLQYAEPDRSSQ